MDRRTFHKASVGAAGVVLLPSLARAAVETNDDGLHIQPWFMETFLDLREDLGELAAEGKRFAVLFEQRGCPYCREMHEVNLQKKQIVDYLTGNFGILQLNLWGSRKVTDFDGEELEERDLARKWAVNFTPTIVFLGTTVAEGKSGKEAEVARMPGYFKPFHFISMFEFVKQEAYAEKGFQRYLQDKFHELEAKGVKPDVW
ncbi:MAG: thioredoxin fold domain-containing protein [Rhizobiales bacterium]|nr:thioredoxin fold domain-containing protein [Hyphomicrobiales bacterium]